MHRRISLQCSGMNWTFHGVSLGETITIINVIVMLYGCVRLLAFSILLYVMSGESWAPLCVQDLKAFIMRIDWTPNSRLVLIKTPRLEWYKLSSGCEEKSWRGEKLTSDPLFTELLTIRAAKWRSSIVSQDLSKLMDSVFLTRRKNNPQTLIFSNFKLTVVTTQAVTQDIYRNQCLASSHVC